MKRIALTTVFGIIICYFSWHTFYGSMGFFNYIRIKHELEEQTAKLELLKLERSQLQNKARLFDSKNVDKDFVDEIARKSLGLVSSSESVIIIGDNSTSE